MKIAVFAPYFTYSGGTFSKWFEYWQKSASMNRGIDFFVLTNVNISQYKKYENIHFISMDAEKFWSKLDSLLGFKVYRGYYKTAEYRVFFGILFENIIQDYDYWGYTDFDVIYGDIMKYIRPYIEKGNDVVGRRGHFRLVRNTDKLRNLPFAKLKGVEHPLNYETVFSTGHSWYYDERGMDLRYYQAGIDVVLIDKYFAHISEMYKYFCILHKEGKLDKKKWEEGKWGFSWQNGKLMGYNNANDVKEFMYVHIPRRKLYLNDNDVPGDNFCIIPNIIINNCKRNDKITTNTSIYTIKKRINQYKKRLRNFFVMNADDILIQMDMINYNKRMGFQGSFDHKTLRRLAYKIKRFFGQ